VLTLSRKTKSGGVVGLDIEAGSVAVAELRQNGSVELTGAAIQPLPAGAFDEGEVTDPDTLSDALKELFGQHKLSKRVRLGVGNQRVVVRTLRLPAIEDPKEMEAAVRFQAQEQIPMPLDQAVLEHQVVGGVPAEEGSSPQVDVVIVAARRDMVASFLEPLRRAGLDPIGVDLSAFGMIRALAGVGTEPVEIEAAPGGAESTQPQDVMAPANGAVLYCNLGDVMNLAVARDRACLFTRVSAVGMEAISTRLAAECGLSPEHTRQWLAHVGLEDDTTQIEGDPETITSARRALEDGVNALVDELRLSLDYYGAQEGAVPADRIVLSGHGSAIPGLSARMQAGLGVPISVARPPTLGGYEDQVAARLTLPFGLALGG
jgi:type IV pilus assembly protein PilM